MNDWPPEYAKDWQITIVGAGSVGMGLGTLGKEAGYRVQYHDPEKGMHLQYTCQVLHITIPLFFREDFYEAVKTLMPLAYPYHAVIIHSTIVLDILSRLQDDFPEVPFFYSPVRSMESKMYEELKLLPWMVAPVDKNIACRSSFDVAAYFKSLGAPQTILFSDAESLILAKLMGVAWFGMNIAFCQQMKLLCEQKGLNFEEMYTLFSKYSRVGQDYTECQIKMVPRPVFKPGTIRGKCVLQDIELALRYGYGAPELWQWVIDTNRKLDDLKWKDENNE